MIELSNLRAKVQMQDKSTVQISAATGLYDNKAETLKLDRDIVLTSSTGLYRPTERGDGRYPQRPRGVQASG